jgi:hypothetical protein
MPSPEEDPIPTKREQEHSEFHEGMHQDLLKCQSNLRFSSIKAYLKNVVKVNLSFCLTPIPRLSDEYVDMLSSLGSRPCKVEFRSVRIPKQQCILLTGFCFINCIVLRKIKKRLLYFPAFFPHCYNLDLSLLRARCSRNKGFKILPFGFLGSKSRRNSTYTGTMNPAILSRQCF